MIQSLQKAICRRKHERQVFNQQVRWEHHLDENGEGNALDMSPWGMFISPEGKMIEKMDLDDPVTVIIDLGHEEVRLNAKIRWAGTSVEHSERGFGLAFDEEALEMANQLMLQIDEKGTFFVPE
jgi:PilZ domain-containing protein